MWRRAARLTGFSQYQPVDGLPSVEPTEVLVWYAPDAIYFGIRAREIHGNVVRATHANRDNIDSEDQIQILLDTDNSRQIAFLFGVNPYGVQQDGTRSAQFAGGAGGPSATGGGFRNINPLLTTYAGADGIKTGYETRAGHCIAASATRNGRRAPGRITAR